MHLKTAVPGAQTWRFVVPPHPTAMSRNVSYGHMLCTVYSFMVSIAAPSHLGQTLKRWPHSAGIPFSLGAVTVFPPHQGCLVSPSTSQRNAPNTCNSITNTTSVGRTRYIPQGMRLSLATPVHLRTNQIPLAATEGGINTYFGSSAIHKQIPLLAVEMTGCTGTHIHQGHTYLQN